MEIRRTYDRLISTMGFPILIRRHLYIESGPRLHTSWVEQRQWRESQGMTKLGHHIQFTSIRGISRGYPTGSTPRLLIVSYTTLVRMLLNITFGDVIIPYVKSSLTLFQRTRT